DPTLTRDAAQQHAREFDIKCPVLIDRAHELVKHTGATITPEAAVLTAGGRLAYRGRIDDRQVALGQRRPRPTRQDLRDALEAILADKTVAHARTKAVGCYIPSLETFKK